MKSVMNVKVLNEAGYNEALLGIATNKKQYGKDMRPVAEILAKAGPGHDKFLEQMYVWIDYTCPRFVHQEIDTYRVGVSKSSESTNHRLVDDVLRLCLNKDAILTEFKNIGLELIKGKAFPYNATSEIANDIRLDTENNRIKLQEYIDKFYVTTVETDIDLTTVSNAIINNLMISPENIQYDKFYEMFEDGENAICKEQILRIVDAVFNYTDKQARLHKLKRLVPESFLQRRVMCINYKSLQNIMDQRFNHILQHWHMFIKQILEQVQHPELFEKVLAKNNATLEDIKNNIHNNRPYILDI